MDQLRIHSMVSIVLLIICVALTKEIEGEQRILKAQEFIEFIESKMILRGFSLTKELLYKLFAKLDTPHRKGYLILQDWINAFGKLISFNYFYRT